MKDFCEEVEKGKLQWLSYNYALLFRALEEHEKMFKSLLRGLEEKNTPLLFIQVDPVWKEFRMDPAFRELVESSFDLGKKAGMVILKSETRETLKIDLRKLLFVEAQENYSRIVWMEDGELKEQLLRVTLKNIEGQIANDYVLRCHRSYMINVRVPYKILGNSNGYHLSSKLFPETIPISRSLGKQIVAILRQQSHST